MRKQVLFPLGGLEQEVDIVKGPDDFDFIHSEVKRMYLYPEKIGIVEGRKGNAAIYLKSHVESLRGEYRIISVLDEGVIKYAVEKYSSRD